MANSSDMIEIMKRVAVGAVNASDPTAIRFGKVISIAPLKIQVEQKMTLTKEFLILTRNVTDHKTKISFDNPEIKQVSTTWNMDESHESSPSKIAFKTKIKHDVTIYNALVVGDEVIMIQMQGGQKFIVIDRL